MAKCKYCNEPAGFMRKSHQHCENKANKRKTALAKVRKKIFRLLQDIGSGRMDLKKIKIDINAIAKSNNIENNAINNFVIAGWERAVDKTFDNNNGILTKEEEMNLLGFMQEFSFTKNDIGQKKHFTKIIKGKALREISKGKLPTNFAKNFNHPFNLMKSETIVWIFQKVKYLEQKKRTKYVGGSKGISVRVVKGVYYRESRYKGERIETHETVHADTGLLGFTTKHIYFSGHTKKFRIRFDKMVTIDQYSNGIGVQRDALTAKPQIFITGDGWFTYRLVECLAQA